MHKFVDIAPWKQNKLAARRHSDMTCEQACTANKHWRKCYVLYIIFIIYSIFSWLFLQGELP